MQGDLQTRSFPQNFHCANASFKAVNYFKRPFISFYAIATVFSGFILQHFYLLNELATKFNRNVGDNFLQFHRWQALEMCAECLRAYLCLQLLSPTSRIRSLREPTKKMSKSNESQWSAIFITDAADVVSAKAQKAATDSEGDGITYEPTRRPGIANLVNCFLCFCSRICWQTCRLKCSPLCASSRLKTSLRSARPSTHSSSKRNAPTRSTKHSSQYARCRETGRGQTYECFRPSRRQSTRRHLNASGRGGGNKSEALGEAQISILIDHGHLNAVLGVCDDLSVVSEASRR